MRLIRKSELVRLEPTAVTAPLVVNKSCIDQNLLLPTTMSTPTLTPVQLNEMTSPVLPQEVLDEIISKLADETSTLKSCSLVCRPLRRSAQKILFGSIVVVLVDDNGPSQPINLVLIVEHAPHLIEYIQKLRISFHLPSDVDGKITDLANASGIFSRKGESLPINLRSLCLHNVAWQFIPPGLQDALVLLMTVHSLRAITLDHISDCPANLVQNLPPLLEHLTLKDTTFWSLPTTRKELPKLESLTIRARYILMDAYTGLDQFPGDSMQCIVNMSRLKTFQWDRCDTHTMPVVERFLRPASNSLEHLTLEQLYIEEKDSMPFDLNQLPQLTEITISHVCYTYKRRPLARIPRAIIWIITTMKNISHRNMIQNLSFRLEFGQMIQMVNFDSVMKDVWQELDAICSIPQLASSKSFRGITFSIQSTALNCDAFSDLVQNKLPVTKQASKLHIKTSSFR
ncbi:hypothetical protein M378DRAFT_639113 [Amanita muscaria Koide BX008]|uniref:F-box domain-containing protein n=1 Tax=Amanita muscaria (strain Koide BX008) TaxID=946122 RepID=A0A0C2TBS1_AMAMK|nr:hypothetical protein M378DRAFT_639113 [Amanita muscaria Koide BX008]